MSLDLLKPCQLNTVISRVEALPSLSEQSHLILNAVAQSFQDLAFQAPIPLATQEALQKGMDLKKSYELMKALEHSIGNAKASAPRDQRIAYLKTAFQVSCLVGCGFSAVILGASTVGSVALISSWVFLYLFIGQQVLKGSRDSSHTFFYEIVTGKNLTLPIQQERVRVADLEKSIEPQKQDLLEILSQYQEKFSESLFQDADFYRRRCPLLLQRSKEVAVQNPEHLEILKKAQQELGSLISFYYQLKEECPAFA